MLNLLLEISPAISVTLLIILFIVAVTIAMFWSSDIEAREKQAKKDKWKIKKVYDSKSKRWRTKK